MSGKHTRDVEIPFGGQQVVINASEDHPLWITATTHDLHMADHNGTAPLFVGHVTLIRREVRVVEPNGDASSIHVTDRRPKGARGA